MDIKTRQLMLRVTIQIDFDYFFKFAYDTFNGNVVDLNANDGQQENQHALKRSGNNEISTIRDTIIQQYPMLYGLFLRYLFVFNVLIFEFRFFNLVLWFSLVRLLSGSSVWLRCRV